MDSLLFTCNGVRVWVLLLLFVNYGIHFTNLCLLVFFLLREDIKSWETNMGDAIDLTGDGGVIKQIVRQAKAGAIGPSEDFPLVDGVPLWILFIYTALLCYDVAGVRWLKFIGHFCLLSTIRSPVMSSVL